MSIILLSCVNLQTCIAIYLFNLFRSKDNFEKALNAFLIILFVHLGIKLSLLVVWKSAFLYNNNATGFSSSYGPLLYLTTLFYLKKPVSNRMILGHMSPLFISPLIFLANSAGYEEGIISRHFISTYSIIFQVGVSASLIIYPLLAWRLLRGAQLDANSPKHKLLAAIIRTILSGILLGLACMTIYTIQTGHWDLNLWILPYICFTLLIVMILRYKMEAGTAATTAAPPETITSAETQPVRQYKKSGLDDEMLDTYEHSIRGFMQQSRIYLEPELSLEELSEQARIPKHHVTQLLNERLHKNFYAFINEYRIEEAMNKLKDPALDINLLSLAYDCGFNSKSSFNNYFKKIAGVTPSIYRKQIQQNIPLTIQ